MVWRPSQVNNGNPSTKRWRRLSEKRPWIFSLALRQTWLALYLWSDSLNITWSGPRYQSKLWRHVMELFSVLLTLGEGNPLVPSQRDAAPWCFLWSTPEQTFKQQLELPVVFWGNNASISGYVRVNKNTTNLISCYWIHFIFDSNT